ncbi:MAG: NifB/NifX family molybdenum-iron cluster-binding protein [bacterium]|nr:NifB/NifX family molybdenum-iron cluster-binding protein [bacterium]
MKIAVPAEDKNLTSLIDDRFGRAKGYIVYDTENKTLDWIDNSKNANASQGAGLKAAQSIIDSGAETLLSYDVGPKAFELLKKSGIISYRIETKVKVNEAIVMFQENKLKKINEGE